MVWSTPTKVQTGGRTWLLGKCPNSFETRMVSRKLSKTTRAGCILLKTVEAGSNFRNVERALYRWSRVADGFDGFDGGFEGFGGGLDGFEGFGGGAIGSAEAHGRAKKWCRTS